MPISVIKQYSVYLANETGSLRGFAELFYNAGINIIAISQDVRYDAAVVRVAVEDDDTISHAITKSGYTSVKTDVICLDGPNRIGLIKEIGELMNRENININSIYGSMTSDGNSKIILVVNDIPRALSTLEKARIYP